MDRVELTKIVKIIKRKWKGDIGVVMNHNTGKGLFNLLILHNDQDLWLGATIIEMDRDNDYT